MLAYFWCVPIPEMKMERKKKTTLGVNVKSLLTLHLIKVFRVSRMILRDRIKKGMHYVFKVKYNFLMVGIFSFDPEAYELRSGKWLLFWQSLFYAISLAVKGKSALKMNYSYPYHLYKKYILFKEELSDEATLHDNYYILIIALLTLCKLMF